MLTGENGTLSAPISGFAGETGAPLRTRAGELPSPGMRDAIFALGPFLPAVAEFGSYTRDFLGLIWPERFAGGQKLLRGERKRGCDFDATFGYPCSAGEKAREAKGFPQKAG